MGRCIKESSEAPSEPRCGGPCVGEATTDVWGIWGSLWGSGWGWGVRVPTQMLLGLEQCHRPTGVGYIGQPSVRRQPPSVECQLPSGRLLPSKPSGCPW